ncbi:MAG: cohesin domain-containing protein [Anaerolineae bacterium]
MTLQFTPAILQVQDANANPGDGIQIQPGVFPNPEFIVRNAVTNTLGIVTYTISDLAPFQPVNGSGVLATINFQGVGQGNTDINITEAILVNSQFQAIPVTTQAAVVAVGLGTALPPTATSVVPPTTTLTPVPGTTPTSTPIVTATFTPPPPTPTFTPTSTFTPIPSPTPTPTNTPVTPQVCIPPDATVGFCYRVQPGETLYNLWKRCTKVPDLDIRFCGIPDPHFISLANDLNPPDYVYPQQILFIPTQYGNGPNVYLTKDGDTLTQIEQDCKLEPGIVAQVNGLPRDATVVSGTPLIIPRPPYPPPSRYPYPPGHIWPPAPGSCSY